MPFPSVRDDLANLIRYSIADFPELEQITTLHDLIRHEKVTIKNEMWKSKGLRRIHLETAETDKIQIVHCVFWPDPAYYLPIFCLLYTSPSPRDDELSRMPSSA